MYNECWWIYKFVVGIVMCPLLTPCNNTKSCFLSLFVANSDYEPGPYKIEFAPGTTSVNQPVYIVDNNVVEGPEFFYCTLTISDDLMAMGVQVDQSVARVNITDNDGTYVYKLAMCATHELKYNYMYTYHSWSCSIDIIIQAYI